MKMIKLTKENDNTIYFILDKVLSFSDYNKTFSEITTNKGTYLVKESAEQILQQIHEVTK